MFKVLLLTSFLLRPSAFVLAVPAASIESLARASHLYDRLTQEGVLKGTVLSWQGLEYDVSKNYILCDGYDGICFKGYQVGFNEPVMLAVSEDGSGQLAIQPVDYIKFKTDRSQEAVKFYQERRHLGEDDVFKMKDANGEFMFDAMGQLTKPGENAYESELEGRSVGGASPAPGRTGKASGPAAAAKKKAAKADAAARYKRTGRSDTGMSKYSIKKLNQMGYREIYRDELDCIHSVPIDDSELILEKVQDKDKLRYFLHPKDPAILIAMKYRRDKVCNPRGTQTFGKE